jgi:hypothetical protein
MLTDKEQAELREKNLVPLVMWGAMLSSVFLYIGISYMTQRQEVTEIDPMFRWVLAFMGLFTGLMSLAVFPIMMPLTKLRRVLKQEHRIGALRGMFFVALILRLSLAESIAIFGLVLAQLSGDPSEILPFAGASIVLLVLSYPSPNAIKNLVIRL